jgi:hypothetical protein
MPLYICSARIYIIKIRHRSCIFDVNVICICDRGVYGESTRYMATLTSLESSAALKKYIVCNASVAASVAYILHALRNKESEYFDGSHQSPTKQANYSEPDDKSSVVVVRYAPFVFPYFARCCLYFASRGCDLNLFAACCVQNALDRGCKCCFSFHSFIGEAMGYNFD